MYLDVLTAPFIFQSSSDKYVAHDNQMSDAGGNTEPATDTEETQTATVGAKRKVTESVRSGSMYVLNFHTTPSC